METKKEKPETIGDYLIQRSLVIYQRAFEEMKERARKFGYKSWSEYVRDLIDKDKLTRMKK